MSYKSYPTFNDTPDAAIRTWNRLQQMYNINADKGEEEATAYAEQFDQKSKNAMYILARYIGVKGYETVKREFMRGDHSTLMEA